MKKRLWIVSELYFPDAQATSRILTMLAEGVSSVYEVNVLCAYPTMQFDPPQAVQRTETRNGVAIRRFVSTHLNKAVLLFRMINLLTISLPVYLHLLFNLRKNDLVLVVTNPPVMPFIAVSASAVSGASVVILTHDVYPDVLVPTNIMRQTDVLYRMLQRAARWLYDRAEGVIVLGRDMEKIVRSYMTGRHVPLRVIPNWSEPDRISVLKREQNRILDERGLLEKFVVQYAGTMGRTHDIEALLACAEQCVGTPDVHFLFAGVGVKRALVERKVQDGHTRNITLLPFLDAKLQNELLNACDLSVISMIEGMCGVSVPSRMYNTMASGKPIIGMTDPDSELAFVIREERIGWVVAPGDVAGLRQALIEAKSDPERCREMGARARGAAETKYTAEKSITGFRQMLTDLES